MAYSVLEPQQIRVLKLEPSTRHDSIITCSLAAISFSDSADAIPQYEALSYVWGDLTEQKEMLLDGQPKEITTNLWTALKYLRQPDVCRTLWIDAVCINQSDMQERNNQVAQMGRIYSQASRVLIWLGPPDAEIESTLSVLQDPGALEGKKYEKFPKEIALGLLKILSQPWWLRIWVIQEHVLAGADPLVGCGRTWLGWKQLTEALRGYTTSRIDASGATIQDSSSTWATDPFRVLQRVLLRQQWNGPDETRRTIEAVVERTRGCQATDKRDQVFAVANLLSETEKEQFPAPDYARSTNQVYQDATVAFIRSSRSLAFLIHAIEKDDMELGLPSWCVDFSKTWRQWDWGKYHNVGGGMIGKRKGEEDIEKYMGVLSHDTSLGTLEVLGGVLGEVVGSSPLITRYSSAPNENTIMMECIRFVKEVLRMSAMSYKVWEHQHGAQAAKERLAEGKVWETAFGGGILFNIVDAVCIRFGLETVDGSDRPRDYWVVEAFVRRGFPWYTEALEGLGLLHPTPELADSPRLKQALFHTLVLETQTNFGSWWFATDTGYVARVDREVKMGDRLCTISGCRAPLVLRQQDGGAYQLIALPNSQDFFEDLYRTREREVKREVLTLV
ncbi:heterokaryon incompatibility protein-domain-containing protein [Rhypophila decipiens]|uniref:Heterokaryon incompatibility protein-domain-containing protein n=1 Tax=Rhypophila decipiens TaxID=261697 RepID=A0AAN7B939_9PEZI|nr:heterokaryon incompatibility protein-domain-containing protein [Rhypophila decipiens]